MSWKNIKTFLILLFIIINTYLILSANKPLFKNENITTVDKETISDVAKIIKNNYNVILKPDIVPTQITNLRNIDVTNIIYTDELKNSEYKFKVNGAGFEADIKTDTFSYNEEIAREQIVKILQDIGIEDNSYTLKCYKDDEGLICMVNQFFSGFPVLNGRIKAVCISSKITIQGAWYITNAEDEKNIETSLKMTDVTSVIIDAAGACSRSDAAPVKIESVDYGYYVTSYDENVVSKSSSAIPCYLVRTDSGLKYYYDASNGKTIKQEE